MSAYDRDRTTGKRTWRGLGTWPLLALVAAAVWCAVLPLRFPTFDLAAVVTRDFLVASAEARSNSNDRAQQEAERARRQAEEAARRAAEEARRAAERAAEQAARAAERAARDAQRASQRAAERAERAAQREAEREAKQGSRKQEAEQSSDKKETGKQAANKEASESNDEDDDRDANGSPDRQNTNARRRATADAAKKDDAPPHTIVELLKRWTGQKETLNQTTARPWSATTTLAPVADTGHPGPVADTGRPAVLGRKRTAEVPAETATTAVVPAARVPSASTRSPRLPTGAAAGPLPPLPDMNAREVLALNVNPQSLKDALPSSFAVEETVHLSHLGMSMVRITAPEGMDAEGARRFLKQQLPNERFEYNRTYRLYRPDAGGDGEPAPAKGSSPLNGSQPCSGDRCYAAAAINWNPGLGSCAKNIRIGVIDTAVDPALFADRKIDYASASPAGQPKAASWHGTGVLALLSGVSRTDMAGLIPDAHFILADTFAADQNGLPVSDTASVLKALDLLRAFDVQVVNMSLSGPPDPAVKSAIERLSKEGVIFVAAAGNGGPTAPPAYPAAYKQVIAVTAVNKELNGYPYANRGNYIDIAAPGVRIWTAVGHRKNDYLSGTSFAAPYVTAVVAALAGRGGMTKAEILNRLAFKDLGTPGPDPVFGRGLIVAPASCGLTSPPEAVTTTPHVPVTTRAWTVVQVNAAQ